MKDLFSKKLEGVGLVQSFITMYDTNATFSAWYTKASAYSLYATPEIENLLSEARYELDENVREDLYRKISRIIYEEAPLVFLYQPIDHYGVSKKVKGFQPCPNDTFYLHKVSLEK